MRIDGQCHCGFVTYEAEIDPDAVMICHCTDCQRLTGSPYRVTVRAAREAVRLTGNQPKIYTKIAGSGRPRLLSFCPECGTPLFSTGTGEAAATWGIRWGSINQRADLKPVRQIWCSSAADWFGETAALPGTPQE
ncbi:GFA family protein [Shinella sp. WSJ-2]|uniref:GFA family protein n=1 Tax=Shinella sp. WSJ-2 TaxID=2303749 RepID=UPI000E3C7013|nr:GFA family protein [Shinella sp. WSJ-2]RFZ88645.1 GFA family protein [Shinella sp. WSJ-2]